MRTRYDERFLGLIDVTKPPYNADNTGMVDCTKILNQIVDDVLKDTMSAMENTYKKLMAIPEEDVKIGFEIRKEKGIPSVLFPEELPPRKIIYFRNYSGHLLNRK